MLFVRTLVSFSYVLLGSLSVALTPFDHSMQVRNAPGTSARDTYLAIRQGLAAASLEEREKYKANIPLERSWDGATLLSM